MTNPKHPGRYQLLHFEWVGLPKDKPKEPQWDIRYWDGSKWERTRYYFDTGGMEEFEPIMWAPLLSIPK